jgi:NTE family protein
MANDPKVAVVLGGGGARGLAHIGVLRVLEREKIPIDLIVGTSAGALVGGMYAYLKDADAVEERFRDFLNSKIYHRTGMPRFLTKKDGENFFGQVATRLGERIVINLAYSRQGLFERKRLEEAIEYLVEPLDIGELRIPFAAIAVDLNSGREIVYSKGDLRQAIEASSSLPGFLPPLHQNSRALVDGAVLHTVPVIPARKLGAQFVLAVNVSADLEPNPELENVIDVLFRANSIMSHRHSLQQLEKADLILRPDVGRTHWANFKRLEELAGRGEAVARRALPILRRLLRNRFAFGYKWVTKKEPPIWVGAKLVSVLDEIEEVE